MSKGELSKAKTIAVLCGGTSNEAEVSLVSGRAVVAALEQCGYRVQAFELTQDALPAGLDAESVVVFPAMHGGYGEGGALQRELEAAGIAYAGSDAAASALCMDKAAAKARIGARSGFAMAASIAFSTSRLRPAAMLWAALQEAGSAVGGEQGNVSAAVLKPRDGGSSVGLFLLDSVEELEQVLPGLPQGEWLLEARVKGREMTVGMLGGKAHAIVEIVPDGGVYDFTRKYRAGMTRYLFPAPLDEALAQRIGQMAEAACQQCGCRDFARVDFILDEAGTPWFLEVNTIPGLTPTSLLPKSVSVSGLDFNGLIEQMLSPAIARSGLPREAFLANS